MKKLLLLLAVVFSPMISKATRAGLVIDTELQTGNGLPLKGKITVDDGEAATLTIDNTSVRLRPTMRGNQIVKIQTEITRTADGESKVLANPLLETTLNSSTEISETGANGSPVFRLKLSPKNQE